MFPLEGAAHLQNIHPLVVHFPIAFLAGAAPLYFAAWIFRRDALGSIGLALLILGAAGALVAAGTGLYAEDGVMIARSVRERLLVPHRNFMLAVAGLSVVTAAWAFLARPFPKKGRGLFLVLLLGLLAVLTMGTDYGARMVYDYNAGGNACSQPIEFLK